MGKRRFNGGGNSNDNRRKKYKISAGILDPGLAGVYVTCPRHKEKPCTDELMRLFSEKIEEYGIKPVEYGQGEEEGDDSDGKKKEVSIEDSIKAELETIETSKNSKDQLIKPIPLGQECLVFIKFRKPIDPEQFIHRILNDLYESKVKRTKFALKFSPVQFSCNATLDELLKLAKKVLQRHFHNEKDQKPVKFAINVNKRNFNTIEKAEIIKKIAESVGRDHGHKVDLKKYQKLVMVECFKNNIGLSVVDDYDKFSRYNVDQMFEKFGKEAGKDNDSRVLNEKDDKKDLKKDEVKKVNAKGSKKN